jgi:transcriptional antiterminator RfaH
VTNVRAERRAAIALDRKGVASYLPQSVRWIVRNRKRDMRVDALMPRYLFVAFKPTDSFWALRSCDGVESVVRFDGEPVRVPTAIIAAFVEREMAGEFDETRKREPVAAFKAGQVVEVTQGPFTALVATVAHCKPGERVHVLLDLMGRKTIAQMDVGDLRATSDEKSADASVT